MAVDGEAAAFGARIRAERQRRRMPLRVLSERTDLSQSFLSQLERGLSQASISSVRRIAEALGIQVADLFADEWLGEPRVLRRLDLPRIAFGDGAVKQLLTPRGALRNLEVLVATIEPGGSTGLSAYAHGDSEELIVVLAGSAKLELGDGVHRLEQGDSIMYASSVSHRLLNGGGEPCEVMWIISPPSY